MNSDVISNILYNSLDGFDRTRLIGITLDNDPVVKALANSLYTKNLMNVHQFGCVCHTFNLVIEEILSICSNIKKTHTEICSSTTDMDNKSCNTHLFFSICKNKDKPPVYFPRISSTRWWTYIRLYKTFINNEMTLRSLASEMEYKTKLVENSWWTEVNNIFQIINCLYNIILVCESDKCTLSMSYDVIKREKAEITRIVIDNAMDLKIIEIFEAKMGHLNIELLNVGNFFNPSERGNGLSKSELIKVKEFLSVLALNKSDCAEEVIKYGKKQLPSYFDPLLFDEVIIKKSSILWWDFFKEVFPNLYSIFMRVSTISISSSPVERSFSCQGLIKNKYRFRLKDEIVDHVLNIKYNFFIIKSDTNYNEDISLGDDEFIIDNNE